MDGIYRWEGIWVLMDSGISQHRVLIRSVHFEASTPMAFATFGSAIQHSQNVGTNYWYQA